MLRGIARTIRTSTELEISRLTNPCASTRIRLGHNAARLSAHEQQKVCISAGFQERICQHQLLAARPNMGEVQACTHLNSFAPTHTLTLALTPPLPCRFAGAPDWDGLDMLNDLIPASVRAQSPTGYNHTHFFRRMHALTPAHDGHHHPITTTQSFARSLAHFNCVCSHIHLFRQFLHRTIILITRPALGLPSLAPPMAFVGGRCSTYKDVIPYFDFRCYSLSASMTVLTLTHSLTHSLTSQGGQRDGCPDFLQHV